MRICLIAEGSYPYIQGGVSSWMHSMIQEMPEHEFIIYAIAPEEKYRGKFKYTLPDHVVEIHEVFLDLYLQEGGQWGHRYELRGRQKEAIQALILGDRELNWIDLFTLLRSPKIKSVTDFLMSRDFFDLLHDLCMQKFAHIPFTELFWSIRSMLLPLFQIVRNPMPIADVYHSVTTGYAGILGSLGKLLYYKPFILTEHGIYSREREEEIIKADWTVGEYKDIWIHHFYTLSHCSYHHANQVITLYEGNKQIEIELGCPAEKIEIIPNGIHASKYIDLPTESFDDHGIFIGAVVRVVPIKDIKTMLLSFKLVKEEVPEAQFYIMGSYEEEPDYYEECLQLVDSLQLDDIVFTGQIDLMEYIHRMDVLVLTSISEGQPLAVLEGMAAGIPYVTTDVGSCRELIYGQDDEFGMAGMVVPIMDYTKIAAAIIQLCKDEQLRITYGNSGRQRVQQYYRLDEQIWQYKQLYSQYRELSVWQV